MLNRFLLAVLIAAIFSISTIAAVPKLIYYQGKLTTAAGAPITGSQQMTFKIWSHETLDTAGYFKWTETNTSVLLDEQGQFSTVLGANPSYPLEIDFSQPLWIEVLYDDGGGYKTFTPRQKLAAVPYAFYSVTAETSSRALTADTVLGNAPAGGWVDDGTIVRLVTTTDTVGIGTANPSATLEVAGSVKVNSMISSNGIGAQGATRQIVSRSWPSLEVESGSFEAWSSLPTPMKIVITTEAASSTIYVTAFLSRVQHSESLSNKNTAYSIWLDNSTKIAETNAGGHAQMDYRTISLHGVGDVSYAGTHVIEVKYKTMSGTEWWYSDYNGWQYRQLNAMEFGK